ncbi:hypothetical protein J1N35_020481 [Gossypium stocksii]|uniref:Uncharacterized protein n=1 Tax=Gossypium stocksii TaxID=47602 RepID=A0A9D3VCJ4_9ROSI|nr:hypothetical protein J1N35_020481 [Gossypium stocksii]
MANQRNEKAKQEMQETGGWGNLVAGAMALPFVFVFLVEQHSTVPSACDKMLILLKDVSVALADDNYLST